MYLSVGALIRGNTVNILEKSYENKDKKAKSLSIIKNQKVVKGIVDEYKNHVSMTEEFAETNKNDFQLPPMATDYIKN